MLLPPPRDPGFIRGGVPRIDWSNPITQGLTGIWLFGLGVPATRQSAGAINNLVTGQSAYVLNSGANTYDDSFAMKLAASSIGRGVNPVFGSYYWNIGLSADLYGASGSFGLVRRNTDTTAQAAGAFGDAGGLECLLPYSDSNIYWRFPTSGSGISFAYTMASAVETWLLTGGTTGRSVFLNGSRKYNDTTTVTAGAPGSNTLWINKTSVGGYTNNEWYVFATWNRRLNDAEGQSWTLAPLQFLQWPEDDVFAQIVGAAAAASFTYFPMTQPDMAFLLRRAEMVGY